MSTPAPAPASTYSIKNPFPARHVDNYVLTGSSSEKETRHHSISLDGSDLKYLPGDALGLVATNCPGLVDELVRALKAKGDEMVKGKDGSMKPLAAALISDYVVNFADKKFVEACVNKGAADLKPLLAPENAEQLKTYLSGRGEAHDYVDILNENPGVTFTPEEFVALLRRLPPRLYSIASSLSACPGEVQLTVATVRYDIRGRKRKGVCSTFLADRWEGDTTAGIYMQSQQKHFSLPHDTNTPIIMVGPGTGVAPFRGFVQERVITGAPGKNWLFFGEQRSEQNFFYRPVVEEWVNGGKLKLTCAWSRDVPGKREFVQHKMAENAAEIWQWLESGAHFYVCGDKSRMAADVDATLHKLVEEHGGKTPEQAKEYVEGLKKAHRYQRDVY
jgi:sulfite reductase (NADPH) flavoprotein alpha-component